MKNTVIKILTKLKQMSNIEIACVIITTWASIMLFLILSRYRRQAELLQTYREWKAEADKALSTRDRLIDVYQKVHDVQERRLKQYKRMVDIYEGRQSTTECTGGEPPLDVD
jgi:hypothetical protein